MLQGVNERFPVAHAQQNRRRLRLRSREVEPEREAMQSVTSDWRARRHGRRIVSQDTQTALCVSGARIADITVSLLSFSASSESKRARLHSRPTAFSPFSDRSCPKDFPQACFEAVGVRSEGLGRLRFSPISFSNGLRLPNSRWHIESLRRFVFCF